MNRTGAPSLHRRLAWGVTGVAAAVLALTGLALAMGYENRLVQADEALLQRAALALRGRLAEGPLPAAQMDAGAGAGAGAAAEQAQLDRAVATLRVAYPELQAAFVDPPAAAGSVPGTAALAGSGGPSVHRQLDANGRAFDAVDMPLSLAARPRAWLRVALPADARERQLRWYRRELLALLAAGTALCAGLAWAVVGRSLRPVAVLSRQARLQPEGEPLAPHGVDVELRDLIDAFNGKSLYLAQAVRQMEGFSADVAHELRSPLSVLIAGTELILSSPRSPQALREALESNLEELERLKALVNDMLFLARAEQGERARDLQRVELGALAANAIEYCSSLFDEARLEVRLEGDASAVCNAALVQRALVNLLTNAAAYGQGPGRVSVHLQAQPGRVRLWVYSPGEPLAPPVCARLFERFYRTGARPGLPGHRHGLGLAIVQAVARMHGGQVFARGEDSGNAIGLELPGALSMNRPPGGRGLAMG